MKAPDVVRCESAACGVLVSTLVSHRAAMLVGMGDWTEGEVLGLDFETTGVDRFSDVPVSYALVSVVGGVAVRSWSGLIDPGREIPVDATGVHGITTERARREGMPLADAIDLVTDAVLAAGRRGVPLVGMKLDYDLTIVDVLGSAVLGGGLVARGWRGPVLDAGVLDRHFDGERRVGERSVTFVRITTCGSRTRTTRGPTRSRRWAWSSPWRIAMPRCARPS